jgi:renalase
MVKEDSIAIVGAGLCGLTISQELKSKPHFIIEKSKSVGGRMATRRDGLATYDHGAQFYSQTNVENFFWHQRWSENRLSRSWFENEKGHFFSSATGMNSLAKDLAFGQKVIFQERVITINANSTDIQISCDSGSVFEADRIILTSPLPQSLDILKNSKIQYPLKLESIHYAKALVGLFQLKDQFNGVSKEFKFLRPASAAIFSIADNRSKGLSELPSWTVVMNEKWSELHFDQPDEIIIGLMRTELESYFSEPIQIEKSQIKKWRYSHPTSESSDFYCSLLDGKIILAGDGFSTGSLRGAVNSALAVVEFL